MALPNGLPRPPDDSGSTTFERYCYQAYVAFDYALICGLGQGITSIVAEYYEDLALELPDRWRFVQIKTRDDSRRPWRLAHLVDKSGALRSLLRTYRILRSTKHAFDLVVALEGAASPQDPITGLLTDTGKKDDGLIAAVRNGLSIEEGECRDFLSHVFVAPGFPDRSSIVAKNTWRLGQLAPQLTAAQLADTHDRVVAKLFEAMQGRLGDSWPLCVLSPADQNQADLVARKRLDRAMLEPLVAAITAPPHPLIRRLLEPGRQPSRLEQKLLLGGASDTVVQSAESLRANATIWEVEQLSGGIHQEQIDDLQERLCLIAEGAIEAAAGEARPAVKAWPEIMQFLHGQASTIDHGSLYQRDPMLLLGVICSLTDTCKVAWGRASA